MIRMSRITIAAVVAAAAVASTAQAGERAPRASGTTVIVVTADVPVGPRGARAGNEAGSIAAASQADASRRPRAGGGFPWFVGNDPDFGFETLLDEPVVPRRPRAGGVAGPVTAPEIEIGARRAKAGEVAPVTAFAIVDPAPRRPRAGGDTEPFPTIVETTVAAAFE